MKVVSLDLILALCALFTQVYSLSVLLQKPEPYCFSVTHMTMTSKIKIGYILTGMKEDQVDFVVSKITRL